MINSDTKAQLEHEFNGLYPLSKKNIKKACEVLANAFSDDPVLKEMEVNYEEICRMYEIVIRLSLRYGKVYATSENFEGIMAITPDKYSNMKMWHLIRSGAIFPALRSMRKFGKIMREMGKILTEDKKNLNIGPYLYLAVIGVSQEFQGIGYGGKLLKALIERAEDEEKSVYLETETEENVNLYKKFGFEIYKKITIPELDLPIWEMVRLNNNIYKKEEKSEKNE